MHDFHGLICGTMLFMVISCDPGSTPNACAQEDILAECDLVYRQADSNEQKSMPAHQLDLGDKPPRALTKVPDFVSDHPLFAALPFADSLVAPLLALDESGGTGTGYDTLYVDANNNADLLDDPVIGMKSQVKPEEPMGGPFIQFMKTDFGTTELSTGSALSSPYHFRCWLESGVYGSTFVNAKVAPAGVLEGQLTVLDRPYRIVFSDSHMNGVFGETRGIDMQTTRRQPCDTMWVYEEADGSETAEQRIASYGRRMYLGGKWLHLSIDSAGKHAEVTDPHVATGSITFGVPPAKLCIENEEGAISVTGVRELEVPAGKYLLTWCVYSFPEEDASLSFWGIQNAKNRYPSFEVRSSRVVKFPFGPPFVSLITTWPNGAVQDVVIQDKEGIQYHCEVGDKGPDIVVRNRRGKTVGHIVNNRPLSDAIPPPYTWKPEPGQNGRFRLSCPLPMFPFKVKAKETVIGCKWWPGSQSTVEYEVVDAPRP